MGNTGRKAPPPSMTLDEFLVWPGDGTSKRFELVDGVARAMSPAAATHGIIQGNLAGIIWRTLRESGSACRMIPEGAVVPRLRARTNLRVPDIVITCAPVVAGQITVPDPLLLVEVLSPSNQASTRESVYACATIPSVREILIIHSTRVKAELFRRDEHGNWPEEAIDLKSGDSLDLETISLTRALAEVYEGSHFA